MAPDLVKVSDMAVYARKIAQQLVEELTRLNDKNPHARLSREGEDHLRKDYPNGTPGPEPKEWQSAFETLSFRYLTSYSIPVPDEDM
jgi:hypothetical protein